MMAPEIEAARPAGTLPGTIRADPESRLPPRSRRGSAVLAAARGAWAATAANIARTPATMLGTWAAWGLIRFLCLRGLERAHLDLAGAMPGGWGLAGLAALALLADFGPALAAAAILPVHHRLVLGASAPMQGRAGALRFARMAAALIGLAAAAGLSLLLFADLPLLLLARLGPVSTILTMILLFPALCLGLAALMRVSFGLPALSLGLPRALAEGWAISRDRVLAAAAVWAIALCPAVAVAAAWLSLRPDPLGWPALLLRPGIDVLLAALIASVTGLFYRAHRLPADLRPDRRPSRNRDRRREPARQGWGTSAWPPKPPVIT